MKEELLKFKKDIKGTYLYLFISGIFSFSVFTLFFILTYVLEYSVLDLDKFSNTLFLFIVPLCIISSLFMFLFSYLGYKNFKKELTYESFYDLRYKFTLCIIILSFIEYSFLGKNIILLIVLFVINCVSIYDMFFSETVEKIRYLNDLDEKVK